MKQVDSKIIICKVSYNWYEQIKANYIVSGSNVTNCWYTRDEEIAQEKDETVLPSTGSLMLFLVEKDDKQIICGGSFYLRHIYFDIESCWNRFGVLSGYPSYDAFLKRAYDFGGSKSQPVSCYLSNGTFLFIKSLMLEIPQDFVLDFKGRSRCIISTDEPLGLYLKKVTMLRRAKPLDASDKDCSWPGINFKATLHRSANQAAQFYTRMLSLYNYECAVTRNTTIPLLELAHIRTIYDERYLQADNAIIMRADIHKLFSNGIITAYYEDIDTVRIKVSKALFDSLDNEYKMLDGKAIILPVKTSERPNPEYLKWHQENRFENWLKYKNIINR